MSKRSNIVMTVVVAIPFALAIRSSLAPHEPDEEDDDGLPRPVKWDEGRDPRRPAEHRYEPPYAPKPACDHAKIELLDKLDAFTSASSDVPGRIFRASLGDPLGMHVAYNGPIQIRYEGGETIDSMTAVVVHDELHDCDGMSNDECARRTPCGHAAEICDKLESKLDRAWGKPGANVWDHEGVRVRLDKPERASYEPVHECSLQIERSIELHGWIDRSLTAPVPLAMIGNKIDSRGMAWTVPGTGRAVGTGHVHVTVEKGIITGLEVNGAVRGVDAEAELVARIEELLGRVKRDGNAYVWPRATLEITSQTYRLRISR